MNTLFVDTVFLMVCHNMINLMRNIVYVSLQWRHNDRDDVSNHRSFECLLNPLFRRRSKKTSKLRITGFVRGIPRWPVMRKVFPFDDVTMLFVISFLVNHVMVIDWRLTTHHYPDSSIPYCCNGNSNKMCQNAYTFSPIILSHQSCPFWGTLWYSIHPFLFISFGRDASNVPHVLTVTARCGVPFVYHVTGDMSLQQLHPKQQIQINNELTACAASERLYNHHITVYISRWWIYVDLHWRHHWYKELCTILFCSRHNR